MTFTATVTSSAGTPTGTVVFYNGTTSMGSASLSGGIASLQAPGFHHGTYPITAAYQGSSSFAGSTSPILYQVVHELVYATSTSLETSRTPILVGQSVTFFASVAARYDGSSPPDGELIYFSDNHGTDLGSVPMQGGSASVTTSALIAAKHTIIARYNGDGVYGKSHGLLTQIVDKYSSTTTLTSSVNPAVYGQPITYTITVASSAPGGPTGVVNLTGVGSLPLVGGVATITKAEVRVGTHTLTAEYKGDDESSKSTSSVLDEVVNPASTTTVLTSSANPSSAGQKVTFTATVTSSTGVDPFGKVTFTAGTTTLGTVALKDGTASVSTAALPVGSTAITAAYGGADGFTGSSVSIVQVVQ